MKASSPQFYNVRVQTLQVVGTLPQFCGRKRAHIQQNLEQVKLPGSVVTNLKIQSVLSLLMMSEREMLLLLYTKLGSNQSFNDKSA